MTQFEYDAYGNLISETDPLNETTRLEYDALHRLTRSIDAVGNDTRLVYDSNGNLLRSIDQLGRVTRFEYDALDRQKKSIAPDPDGDGPLSSPISSFDYDAVGNLIATIGPAEPPDRNRIRRLEPNGDADRFRSGRSRTVGIAY